MYCRTKDLDDESKRQQTQNNQERRTVFTHDYNKRRGPNIGSQKNQTFNKQPRYGNQKDQTPYRQTGFNPDRNKNPNSDRHYHQNRSSNSWNNGPNNRQQTKYNFNAKPENSDTQCHKNVSQSNNLPTTNSVQFIGDQAQDVVNTLSSFFPLNFRILRDLLKKATSNHVFKWMPSKFPPETAKKIVDSKSNFCSTLEQHA